MKRLLLSLTLCLSSVFTALSCGFSPYGEDVRMSLFLPSFFQYGSFSAFSYNAHSFGFEFQMDREYDQNVVAWYNFVSKKVPLKAIDNFLYFESITDLSANSNNDFVRYLYENKIIV